MHQKAKGERDVPFLFPLIKPVGKPTMEWIMNKILKKAALPALALAAAAFAAPAARADLAVQYYTTLSFTGNGATTGTTGPTAATYVAGQVLDSPTQGYNSDGSTSSVTFDAGHGGGTITYNGEQDYLTATDGGSVTTFGGFTTTGSVSDTATPVAFSLNVYELLPQLAGPGTFVGTLTGTFTTGPGGNIKITLTTDTFTLPSGGTPPPAVVYTTQTQFIKPNVAFDPNPNDSAQNEIRGEVQSVSAPLPKTASVSLALFGLLGAFGLAKRKTLNIA
jgi:hypothetical protein